MNEAVIAGKRQHVHGLARKWWEQLADGGLEQSRPVDSFLGELWSRFAYLGERTAKENRRPAQKPKTMAEVRLAKINALPESI